MTLSTRLNNQAAQHGLFVMGHTNVDKDTLILIGADRSFWTVFTQSNEYSDGHANPIDRWSKRIIDQIAADCDGHATYPSDGPPYAPFISWATATGRFWQSPTGMLIHDTAGLMISIRGAIRVPNHTSDAIPTQNPCDSCVDRPCTVACPVAALSAGHFYDVPKCKQFLITPQGIDCMSKGCLVRQVCPLSKSFDRADEQSAFHMNTFMGIANNSK
jgi:hypothetical protein